MALNLICFPHFTCGGLLTTMLNDEMGVVVEDRQIVSSWRHQFGKRIVFNNACDNESVFRLYNTERFLKEITCIPNIGWISTHCWPGPLILHDSFNKIDQILNITTVTLQSRLLREHRVRALSPHINDYTKHSTIVNDSYAISAEPVFHKKIINLEFSDVVFCTGTFIDIVNLLAPNRTIPLETHMDRWRKLNYFLYE